MQRDLCERTFKFALDVTNLCKVLLKGNGVGQMIGQQLLRSGTSIGANVEEGQGGQSKADFLHKYSVARKEARETHYWLRLLVGSKVCSSKEIGKLIKESDELIAILTSIIKKTKDVG